MLLTTTATLLQSKPDFRHPHDFIPRPSPPSTTTTASSAKQKDMATQHRGLPPPAGMTLPDPTRGNPANNSSTAQPSLPHSLAPMPAPPQQWHGAEDSMRDWLGAKTEEDRRKQQEEKTRQEELRLEQRRIEQNMLRESIQVGVPPHLIPVVFAGLGGGPLASASLEMAQQYLVQLQQAAQLPPRSSPDLRRDHQQLPPQQQQPQPHHPLQYVAASPVIQSAQQPGPAPAHVLPSQSQLATVYPSPAYQSPKSRSKTLYSAPQQYGPHSASARPNPAQPSNLPRLTTNEATTVPPSSYTQQQHDQTSPSPSIYFHHWQPPTEPSSAKNSSKTSPNVPSHVSGPDHSNSPRKRKATGPHHPAPPPTSHPSKTSPTFSVDSSGSARSQSHRNRPRSDSHKNPNRNYDPIRSTQSDRGKDHSSRDSTSSAPSRADEGESLNSSPHKLPGSATEPSAKAEPGS